MQNRLNKKPSDTIVFCTGSNTLRLMPSNNCIAARRNREWVMFANPAVSLDVVLMVTAAIHSNHDVKWNDPTGSKLMSCVTGDDVSGKLQSTDVVLGVHAIDEMVNYKMKLSPMPKQTLAPFNCCK